MSWISHDCAWVCHKGHRDYVAYSILEEHRDCNMQFSVNCGSIVRERTYGKMRIDTWVRASRATSLWHAHQEKVANEIIYLTHENSFDYGCKRYEELKHAHPLTANGYQQNLGQGRKPAGDYVSVTNVSAGSAMLGDIVKTNQSSDPVGG